MDFREKNHETQEKDWGWVLTATKKKKKDEFLNAINEFQF